jgi:hypothetical protein
MKRISHCLWALLVLWFVPVYGQNNTFREIDNEYAQFRIPSDWEYMEGPQGVLFSVLSPQSTAQDSFRENFNLVMVRLNDNEKPDAGLLGQAGTAMLQHMRSLLPDLQLENLDSGIFAYGKHLDIQASSAFSRLVWNWRIFEYHGHMYFFTITGRRHSGEAKAFRDRVYQIFNTSMLIKKTAE